MSYHQISLAEMDEFLTVQGFVKMNPKNIVGINNASEEIYAKRVDKNNFKLSLRVYTSIGKNGRSRPIGADAIRTQLVRMTPEGKARQVRILKNYRTPGWATHLQENINQLEEYQPLQCEQCDGLMILRNGRRGKFYGCSNYPRCKCTKNEG